MWEDQIWTHKVAWLWFAILSCNSGLFGLYDLGIQTKANFWSINSKLPQTNEKSTKFWFLCLAFDLAFVTFIGLLQFFRDPWCLRSPVMCSSHKSEHYFIKKQFSHEICHFGSVCSFHNCLRKWVTNFEYLILNLHT